MDAAEAQTVAAWAAAEEVTEVKAAGAEGVREVHVHAHAHAAKVGEPTEAPVAMERMVVVEAGSAAVLMATAAGVAGEWRRPS